MATMGDTVGVTAALWRFPVKSMLGEAVDTLELTDRGFVGDRAYALVDTATGTVVSAKRVRRFPGLFACRAAFVDPPRAGGALPPVRITLGDGTPVRSDAPGGDGTLSRWFGRDVRLASVASEASASEGFFDAFPVTVLTTSTLDRLNRLRPESRFDERRFRMNVMVGTEAGGFVENTWIGRRLQLGDRAGLRVVMPDARCVMTTLDQDDLPEDAHILRTLREHNRLDVNGTEQPCAGVYAVVESPGTVQTGQAVVLF